MNISDRMREALYRVIGATPGANPARLEDEAAQLRAKEAADGARYRAETFRALLAVADKLKKIEPCAASSIEGHACITADARWCGREVGRRLRGLITEEDRRAIDALALADLKMWLHEVFVAEDVSRAKREAEDLFAKEAADHRAWLRDNAASVTVPEHPAVALLRSIEWIDERVALRCPMCRNAQDNGHDSSCGLAKILASSKPGDRALAELLAEEREAGRQEAELAATRKDAEVFRATHAAAEKAIAEARAEGFAAGKAHGEDLGWIRLLGERERCLNICTNIAPGDGPTVRQAIRAEIEKGSTFTRKAEEHARTAREEGAAAEREACAQKVEAWLREGYDLDELPLAIRERGGAPLSSSEIGGAR